MDEAVRLYAEFETLGDAEVTRRLDHHEFDNHIRVFALRWLNDRGVARTIAAAPPLQPAVEPRGRGMRRDAATFATIGAAAALVAAVVSASAAFESVRAASDIAAQGRALVERLNAFASRDGPAPAPRKVDR